MEDSQRRSTFRRSSKKWRDHKTLVAKSGNALELIMAKDIGSMRTDRTK